LISHEEGKMHKDKGSKNMVYLVTNE